MGGDLNSGDIINLVIVIFWWMLIDVECMCSEFSVSIVVVFDISFCLFGVIIMVLMCLLLCGLIFICILWLVVSER